MVEDGRIEVSAALARADASYRTIQGFDNWAPADVDTEAWDSARLRLATVRAETDAAEVAAALTERLRAAAVDTGAIEGLYATDRGFTMSVAQETISLDQAEVEKGAEFRRNFEAQLAGFELALDVATSATPISEALIRRLHEVTCAGQPFHRVITSHGVQERQLELGSYKTEPNHVQLGDGSFHAYAPVGEVSHEMRSLVEQLRSSEFESGHPVVQAAYAHHALTSIHPFADGNGRVARLLASIWLLRSASIPLWVEPSDRDRYLDALEAADRGDGATFVAFTRGTTVRLLRELRLTLEVAGSASQREDMADATALARRWLSDHAHVHDLHVVTRAGSHYEEGHSEFVGHVVLSLWNPVDAARPHRMVVRVDETASPADRLQLIGFDSPTDACPSIDERIGEDEVAGGLAPSAERRLEAILKVVSARLHRPMHER